MKDIHNNELHVGDMVVFASVDSKKRPYLNKGVITKFGNHPSFEYMYIKTVKGRKTRKYPSEVLMIGE